MTSIVNDLLILVEEFEEANGYGPNTVLLPEPAYMELRTLLPVQANRPAVGYETICGLHIEVLARGTMRVIKATY